MQLAEQVTPLSEYRGQHSDFDDLMEVPIRRFGSIEDIDFDLTNPARYVVLDPRYTLPIDMLFIPRQGSDRLLVGFHGAENRAVADFPKFQFVRSFMSRSESLLFVSDTTLLQGPKINIGWLAGNKDTPLVDLVAHAVRRAAEATGAKRTVLAGHSAGGYAAILVGSKVPNSRAISVNGQTVVQRYDQWTVTNLWQEAFPECVTQGEMVEVYAERLDLRVGLSGRLNSSTFTYFGSRRDKSTFGRLPHFPLLADHFGLDAGGGITDHGDALVPCDWATVEPTGHALPGSILPFIQLVLGEPCSLEVRHSVNPVWETPSMTDYTADEFDAIIANGGADDPAFHDRDDLRDYPAGNPLLGEDDRPMVFPNDGRPVQYFADYSMNRWARELGKAWTPLPTR